MLKKNSAQLVADLLSKEGVTHVFDIAGGMIAYIEDAVGRHPRLESVPCRHEQGCGFAAEGYARISQSIGVAMATSGPGATNLITPIGSCYFDSVPTMFITGQVHTDDIRKDQRVRQLGFQETDIVSIVKPITKYAVRVLKVEDILYEFEKAMFIARSGRKGPVLIDIPINIQRTEVDLKKLKSFYGSVEHESLKKSLTYKVTKKVVKSISNLLQSSKRPIVLVGGGIRLSHTMSELKAFVEKNNLPVVSSLMGLDSFPGTHPQFVGFIGSYGTRHANIIFANADLIISLGSRMDVRQTGSNKYFAKQATVVHVDIDKFSIGANIRAQIPVIAGLKDFFIACKNVSTPPKKFWLEFVKQIKNRFGPYERESAGSIDPNKVIEDISEQTDSKAVVSIDVGNHQMWTAQSWLSTERQRLLFSGGMGSMGFGLPAAIGSYFADPTRQNILICGDGGFQMNIQELETVRHNKIPLKIFVLNNKSLGMVKEFQDQYLNKNYQSTFIGYSHPNFGKIAAAFDLSYVLVSDSKKQKMKIKNALKHPGAILVEIVLDLHTPVYPKVMYGHALDDQYPFLSKSRRNVIEQFKKRTF